MNWFELFTAFVATFSIIAGLIIFVIVVMGDID